MSGMRTSGVNVSGIRMRYVNINGVSVRHGEVSFVHLSGPFVASAAAVLFTSITRHDATGFDTARHDATQHERT